jgi:hypothetical protein
MNEHERGFLAFLAEPTKRRVGTLLELGPKRRKEVRDLLSHSVRLDPRCCRHLAGHESLPDAAQAVLKKLGAPERCFVIAAHREVDGCEMPLGEALEAVARTCDAAFISCLPGRLGLYTYEEPSLTYLLSR